MHWDAIRLLIASIPASNSLHRVDRNRRRLVDVVLPQLANLTYETARTLGTHRAAAGALRMDQDAGQSSYCSVTIASRTLIHLCWSHGDWTMDGRHQPVQLSRAFLIERREGCDSSYREAVRSAPTKPASIRRHRAGLVYRRIDRGDQFRDHCWKTVWNDGWSGCVTSGSTLPTARFGASRRMETFSARCGRRTADFR